MSISVEQLKTFQLTLESANDETKTRAPVNSQVAQWAMIETVLLLTAIKDSLNLIAKRP